MKQRDREKKNQNNLLRKSIKIEIHSINYSKYQFIFETCYKDYNQ